MADHEVDDSNAEVNGITVAERFLGAAKRRQSTKRSQNHADASNLMKAREDCNRATGEWAEMGLSAKDLVIPLGAVEADGVCIIRYL